MADAPATVVGSVRQLCVGHIDAARLALSGAAPTDLQVHCARRELKRARAILRLLRETLPPSVFRSADRSVRAVHRRLGGVRDAAVFAALVRAIGPGAGISLAATHALVRHFNVTGRKSRTAFEGARARANLTTVRVLLTDARLEGDEGALAAAMAAVYRRGRRAYRLAREHHDPAYLHAWRRHVRYYGHVLEVLAPIGLQSIDRSAQSVDRLGELLGRHHDCAALAQALHRSGIAPATRRSLLYALKRKRARLRREALPLGADLYGGRVRRCRSRATRWWLCRA